MGSFHRFIKEKNSYFGAAAAGAPHPDIKRQEDDAVFDVVKNLVTSDKALNRQQTVYEGSGSSTIASPLDAISKTQAIEDRLDEQKQMKGGDGFIGQTTDHSTSVKELQNAREQLDLDRAAGIVTKEQYAERATAISKRIGYLTS